MSRLARWVAVHGRTGAVAARRAWRRSLQLRVVATTMVLGLVAVSLVAAFLAAEISDRLFESRRDQAELEAGRALAEFRDSLATAQVDTPARVQQFLNDSVPLLAQPGLPSDRRVLLLRSPNNDGDVVLLELAGLPKDVVPVQLREALRSSTGQFSQPVAIPEGDGTVPGLVVGQQVAIPLAGPYELYFVFSLQREQETLEAVQRVLFAGGAALVVLVGAVAFVVTRQVVAPVRQAAAVAGRLSSGRLDERMAERGDDDLARLARSFNDMAGSLQSQIERMEELSRLQRRFVSDVSHELRTPLTTIRMAGEVLHESRHTMDPAVRRSAELLATQLDRFEELLADLLEISRFDAGAAALEAEPADVRGVVDRVVDLAQPLAERKGIDLRTFVPDTPCMAEIDARRVERIVRNLVVNAVEHGEGRPVDVRLAADANAVAVVVRDRGVGLRPQDAERVFDRFWRADPARARTSGGTGLGLAISLEDAHLHGGTLEAWGMPGQGASFRLTLPRRAGVQVHRSPLPLVPVAAVGRAGGAAARPTPRPSARPPARGEPATGGPTTLPVDGAAAPAPAAGSAAGSAARSADDGPAVRP
ncbi:MtrAB system histidine kinase MtrB [Thalassiella azotivora]